MGMVLMSGFESGSTEKKYYLGSEEYSARELCLFLLNLYLHKFPKFTRYQIDINVTSRLQHSALSNSQMTIEMKGSR